ncbi:MAG: UDP-N-acetylglucosamine pyrophosphorylase [Cytophagaceae bacterium]
MNFSYLLDISKTIAGELFKRYPNSWEVLPHIESFIIQSAKDLPSDFEQIQENVWVAKNAKIAQSASLIGPVIIGYETDIRHCAFVRNNVIIGNQVTVGNSTEVKNAILFDNVEVPHYNYVGDSVLGFKAHMGAGSILSNFKSTKDEIHVVTTEGIKIKTGLNKFGAILGDYAEIGCNAVLNPGTIIGRNSIVYPLLSVRGTVPDNHILKKENVLIKSGEK